MRHFSDIGKLLLRFGVGSLMFFHGLHKLLYGFENVKSSLIAAGMPELLWLGVPIAEIVAPILLIVGLFTRASSLLIAITMFMSFYLVLGWNGFALNQFGGFNGELNLLFLFSSLALFFLGAGRFSLSNGKSVWMD